MSITRAVLTKRDVFLSKSMFSTSTGAGLAVNKFWRSCLPRGNRTNFISCSELCSLTFWPTISLRRIGYLRSCRKFTVLLDRQNFSNSYVQVLWYRIDNEWTSWTDIKEDKSTESSKYSSLSHTLPEKIDLKRFVERGEKTQTLLFPWHCAFCKIQPRRHVRVVLIILHVYTFLNSV